MPGQLGPGQPFNTGTTTPGQLGVGSGLQQGLEGLAPGLLNQLRAAITPPAQAAPLPTANGEALVRGAAAPLQAAAQAAAPQGQPVPAQAAAPGNPAVTTAATASPVPTTVSSAATAQMANPAQVRADALPGQALPAQARAAVPGHVPVSAPVAGNPAAVTPNAHATAMPAANPVANVPGNPAASAVGNPALTGAPGNAAAVAPGAATTAAGDSRAVMPAVGADRAQPTRPDGAPGHTLTGNARRGRGQGGMSSAHLSRLVDFIGNGIERRAAETRERETLDVAMQWIFWVLAIVAYACLGFAVLAFLPIGEAFVPTTATRGEWTGSFAVLGLFAAVGAWWLARKMSRGK